MSNTKHLSDVFIVATLMQVSTTYQYYTCTYLHKRRRNWELPPHIKFTTNLLIKARNPTITMAMTMTMTNCILNVRPLSRYRRDKQILTKLCIYI